MSSRLSYRTEPWSGLLPPFADGLGRSPEEARLAELLDTLPVAVLTPLPLTSWGDKIAAALDTDDLPGAEKIFAEVDEPGARMWLVLQAAQNLGFTPSQTLSSVWRGSALALMISAAALAMGAREGSAPDPDEFEQMAVVAYRGWADELLGRAEVLAPEDPTPLMLAQHCWHREDGKDAVLARASRWQPLAPWSYSAYSVLITQLAGIDVDSAREAWDLALALSEQAPLGAAIHGLVPSALMERLISSGGEDPGEDERPEVLHAVRTALSRSADIEGWSDPWVEPRIRNDFAFTLYSLGAREEALQQMLALDGQVTMAPWALMDSEDPTLPWESVRAELMVENYSKAKTSAS